MKREADSESADLWNLKVQFSFWFVVAVIIWLGCIL